MRRGGPVLVESAGQEPMVLLDALLTACCATWSNRAGAGPREPEGAALRDVLDRYLSEEISLGKAAELLELSRWELQARLRALFPDGPRYRLQEGFQTNPTSLFFRPLRGSETGKSPMVGCGKLDSNRVLKDLADMAMLRTVLVEVPSCPR